MPAESDGTSEHLSQDDEVAWTPRSLAPDSPAAVPLVEVDEVDEAEEADEDTSRDTSASSGSHVLGSDPADPAVTNLEERQREER